MSGAVFARLESEGPAVLSGLLRAAASLAPDAEAVVSYDRGVRLSFRDLDREADRIARACIARGLRPGDRALLWSPNLPEWPALEYGLARAGLVLVPVGVALKAAEVAELRARSRPAITFFAPGPSDRPFGEALTALADPPESWLVGLDGASCPGSLSMEEFLAPADGVGAAGVAKIERSLDPEAVVQIQFTSGTTARPKGVCLSHRNLLSNARAMGEGLGLCARERLCLVVPLFHCFGCVVGTLVAHSRLAAMILHDRFDPDRILDAVSQERCTAIYGVPTMYVALLEAQRRRHRDLSSLRVGVMAGAPCPADLIEQVEQELHVPGMVAAYGLTEASPGVTLSRPTDSPEARRTTVGRPLEGVEVRVADPETGAALPSGSQGELWCRGPNVMLGYLDDPESTRKALTPEGWLRTGDLAVEDGEGRLRIVGRLKDLIIRGGENLSPAEIEAELRRHPAVLDAAVFGVSSAFFGEEPAAAVRRVPGRAVSVEELQEHVRRRLSEAKVPVRILFVEAFPLTGSGKVRRHELRQLVERDETAGPPSQRGDRSD